LQDADVVSAGEFLLLAFKKFGTVFCFLVKFLCFELNIDEVRIFKQFGKFIEFSFLKDIQLLAKRVKEVDDALAELVFEVKLLTRGYLLSAVY